MTDEEMPVARNGHIPIPKTRKRPGPELLVEALDVILCRPTPNESGIDSLGHARSKRVHSRLVCCESTSRQTRPTPNESVLDSFGYARSKRAWIPPRATPICHPLSRPTPNESGIDSLGHARSKRVYSRLVCCGSTSRQTRQTRLPPTQPPDTKRVHSGLVWCSFGRARSTTPICHPPNRLLHSHLALNPSATHPIAQQQTSPFPDSFAAILTSHYSRLPTTQFPDTKRVRSGLVWLRLKQTSPEYARLLRFHLTLPPSATHPIAWQQTSPKSTRLLHFHLALNPSTHTVARHQTSLE
ncbi:hypothetical protein F5050DRAFT_1898844 [Lentinula boryana]|uniref:Uncharacterized protein n=1 Tax=Lentinula boryana TaxID=40481 RepID=A0ABQ8PVY0_9AGAR|nr:hypothetical protein F5050DRAFT_1898844 [Lentinula boryana]